MLHISSYMRYCTKFSNFLNKSCHLSLPPAYVVRREGNSFTLFVCPHLGGYPYPIMLCNISQNAMRQRGGTQTPPGGYLTGYPPGGVSGRPPGVPRPPRGDLTGYPPRGGTQTPPGYPDPPGGYPDPPRGGYPDPGGTRTPRGGVGGYLTGYPPGGGTRTPPGGVPDRVPPRGGGGTQVGQQKEYSLHGGRYASCVHAGGLSC